MELSTIIPHIEALIFASDKPLTSLDIVELINTAFGFMEERISLDQVEAAVEGICEKYNAEFYPFEVRESGGGWQFLTKKEFHQTVGQLNGDKFLKRLSNAALETLAIVAYKQPITKGEVETIRGVNSDYSIQKLLEKELIVISGRNENLPGKPLVYATSKAFMDYFGINDTNDLPKIKEVLAEQMIEATVVNSALNAQENDAYREGLIDDTPKQQIELFENKKEETADNESDVVAADLPEETAHTVDETSDLNEDVSSEGLDEETADDVQAEPEIVTSDNLEAENHVSNDEDESVSGGSDKEDTETPPEKPEN